MAQKSLAQKIIEPHLVEGIWGDEEIAVAVDQCLLQDATGTQACQQLEELVRRIRPQTTPSFIPATIHTDQRLLMDEGLQDGIDPLLQFEQFGVDCVKVPLAVQYVDHNIKQIDERNADDHAFLLSFAQRYGIWYSPLGNGICHQVHVERFAIPGAIIIGADSHTTTSGAMGTLALGAGGLDVAAILAGHPFLLRTPKIVQVELYGMLKPWVSATDIILELLSRYKVSWGTSIAGIGGTMILEFTGSGVETLRLTQRATIANMAAELNGTALFPSDARTREFLKVQRRARSWRPLRADPDARYDLSVRIDLDALEPLVAMPSNPDNVVPVREAEGTPFAQIAIGSSVNSWYEGMVLVAKVLAGHRLPLVKTSEGLRLLQLLISPGSQQILNVLERKGFMKDFRKAGATVLESACGPCVGMGGAPPSGANSLRTMNRNFPGRSGTKNDRVWLASPEVAAATALTGILTDPRRLGSYPDVGTYTLRASDFTDHLFVRPLPEEARSSITIIRGPHITPPPRKEPLSESISGEIIARFSDNTSTGSISPDGVIVMGKRSNVGDIAQHTFEKEMPSAYGGVSRFYLKARDVQKRSGGFVVAGYNYGQGSSREAAAMVMVELSVHAIFAKSFARIHRGNLIAQGILPIVISDEIYDAVLHTHQNPLQFPEVTGGQVWTLPRIRKELEEESDTVTLRTGESEYLLAHNFSETERRIALAGGLINYYLKQQSEQ